MIRMIFALFHPARPTPDDLTTLTLQPNHSWRTALLWRSCLALFLCCSPAVAQTDQLDCPRAAPFTPAEVMERFLDAKNYRNFYMVCAHRGMWLRAPENTTQSIEDAVSLGIDCIEDDVRQTSDGYLVMFHDSDLNARLYDPATGKAATGLIKDKTLAELKALRYIDVRDTTKTQFQILTLEEYLALTNDRIVVNHEIKVKAKDKPHEPDYVKNVFRQALQTVKDHGRLSQTIVKHRDIDYTTYKEWIDGIATEEEITYTPIIFADSPTRDHEFNSFFDAGYRNFELVVQTPDSALLPLVAKVRKANGRIGQFDVIPENGRGSYWVKKWVDPTEYTGHWDTRADWDFIVETARSNYIISDRPCLMTQYLALRNLRNPAGPR